MALTDPQTITVNSVEQTLNRIKSDGYRSEYADTDEEFKMTISHQESKSRTRRMVRVDQRVVAADPLTSVNEYKSLGVYVVIDEPEYGFSDTEIDYVVQALTDWLTTANVTKVLGNQH
jgi:predicted Zn-dependent peptidase